MSISRLFLLMIRPAKRDVRNKSTTNDMKIGIPTAILVS